MNKLGYPFDHAEILAQKRKLKRELLSRGSGMLQEKRIAILGGSTTEEIKNILEVFLLFYGIEPVFYESGYGHYFQDAVFGNEKLVEHSPEIVYFYTSMRNVSVFPSAADGEEDILRMLGEEFNRFTSIWQNVRETYHCTVIQNNFELPSYRLLGNRDCYDIHGRTHYIHELNSRFYHFAREHEWFHICDLNYISADYGLYEWHSPKYWYMYKYAVKHDGVPFLAWNVANIIKSLCGKNKKGVVVDLDNTLWGGLIGEDGIEGIEIGKETPSGEAFWEFQEYLRHLKEIGVILAAASKNDLENAVKGINHPSGVLKEGDFVEIRADWENKDVNLRDIAQSIGILPESLIFIDDNPAERHMVASNVDGVITPDMEAPEEYIRVIDRLGAFEAAVLSDDDVSRPQMYLADKKRRVSRAGFQNYRDYLLSLEMKARIEPFRSIHFSRIAQLANKSNQYNLTTKRMSREEIEAIAGNENYVTLQGQLEDRFGDNGIVSLVIGAIDGSTCNIILWVMSCRVLKRDMEFAMMDAFAERCSSLGIKDMKGVFIPSGKNMMVKDHYERLGFRKAEESDGETAWQLGISEYDSLNKAIEII